MSGLPRSRRMEGIDHTLAQVLIVTAVFDFGFVGPTAARGVVILIFAVCQWKHSFAVRILPPPYRPGRP